MIRDETVSTIYTSVVQYIITMKSMNINKVNEEITLEQTRVQNCVLSQNDPGAVWI